MSIDYNQITDALRNADLTIHVKNAYIFAHWPFVIKTDKPWIHNRHVHGSYGLHLVISGACNIHFEKNRRELLIPNKFYITRPYELHGFESVKTKDPLIKMNINFSIKSLEEDMQDEWRNIEMMFGRTKPILYDDDLLIGSLTNQFFIEGYKANYAVNAVMQSLLCQIIALCARRIAMTEKIDQGQITNKQSIQSKRAEAIVHYIRSNCSNCMNVSDIANYMSLSSKQVCRIAKEYFGLTTSQLIASVS